jgi:two-component system NarL family response regulator
MSAKTPGRIRLLCVEDHLIVREGIILILEQQRDFEVVGSATTGEEAVSGFRRYRPDVTLMDLQLPGMSGLDAIRAIRHGDPLARIVVLTVYQGEEDIYRALQAGAATYLLKDTLSDELVRVIRAVYAGEHPVVPAVQARLEDRAARPPLTRREISVLDMIAQGLRNKEIAISLDISEETVQVHVRNILAKLDADSRTAAIRIAARRGIIHMT